MKIVRRSEASVAEDKKPRLDPWKVLIVDDEPDVRRVTVLNLRGFQFAGRGLNFLEASSAAEAKVILQDNDDLALALVDVVMETDDAGLKLVEYIRSILENRMIRLIIRTGQPGVAPERYVIDNFDIDDYKDKSELTAQRLYTTVRTALKSYRDLLTIEASRIGLSRILNVTPDLYNLHRDRLEEYFQGVLMQTIGICNLDHSGLISTIDGLMLTLDGKEVHVRAGTGQFSGAGNARSSEIVDLCSRAVTGQDVPEEIRRGAVIVPLQVGHDTLGFVYLESQAELSPGDRELIQVMANQCAAALDNFRLHHSLEDAYAYSRFARTVLHTNDIEEWKAGLRFHQLSMFEPTQLRDGDRVVVTAHDERLDRDHDFTNKSGVVHSEVMLPDNAPEHLSDREKLWNAVEAAEVRKDAQLAREVEFAIPRELTQQQGIELARDFAQSEFVSRGMIADLNVHWDMGADGMAKPHAHVMLGHAHEDRDHLVGPQRLAQVGQDLLLRRLLVLEQLFHQLVVEIGQRLEHLATRTLLALPVLLRQRNTVGSGRLAVGVRLLGDQIDVADQSLALADRELVRQHWPRADLAQRLQQVAVGHLGPVHLVDEDDMRKVEAVEILQEGRDRDHPLDHRLDHDDGKVDAEQGLSPLVDELDRPRTVEDGEVVTLVLEAGDADLGAHLAVARFGAGIANGVAVGDPALAGDGAGYRQQAFQKGRLAGTVGPHQG